MILDIKERWGLFLVENDLEKIEKEYKDESSLIVNEAAFTETRAKFNTFMNDLRQLVKNKYEFFTLYYYVKHFITIK